MELWDAYNADETLAGVDLVRGEAVPENETLKAAAPDKSGAVFPYQPKSPKNFARGSMTLAKSSMALFRVSKSMASSFPMVCCRLS